MTRRYYLQYQYMPYYIASLAILYYLPYIFFRIVNTDMISLKKTVDKPKIEAHNIVENYFNYAVNTPFKMNIRLIMNAFVKLLYIGVNVAAFFLTNELLYGNYKNYGIKWAQWARLNHTSAFSFYEGDIPKPGNILLPSFGFCEIQEGSLDIKQRSSFYNLLICEISPNVLYQYTFIVLWICMVISIAVSILGCVFYLIGHIGTIGFSFFNESSEAKYIYKKITLRECEYLTFIRHKNIPLYGDILRLLKRSREGNMNLNGTAEQYPSLVNGNGYLTYGRRKESIIKRGSAPPDEEETHWTKL